MMPLPGPIVVGGVGGSGTRVVAQMLLKLGVYLGRDLNISDDNVWFTVLFRNPGWLARADEAAIQRRMAIFERAMLGEHALSLRDLLGVSRAAVSIAYQNRNWKNVRYLKRIWTFVRAHRVDMGCYAAWGWKEPNTHVYLRQLNAHFPDLRYIHTIRNGLDMAYSANQQQVINWGALAGIELPDLPELLPRASLEYWVKANQTAIEYGQTQLSEHFYLLNFDALCANPSEEIDKLLTWLALPGAITEEQRESLYKLPQTPPSVGRYKQHDLSIHRAESLVAVRALGFPVD
ncbi:MAG: sulfotransferase [Anaerolineae bacterium]|nr:sulfotransferase [Anaerolineae bacterium]